MLLFDAASAGEMPQQKIDELFMDMLNIVDITDGILIDGYNENIPDHDTMLRYDMQMCRKENLRLNKEKCHFRCLGVPTLWEIITRDEGQPDL